MCVYVCMYMILWSIMSSAFDDLFLNCNGNSQVGVCVCKIICLWGTILLSYTCGVYVHIKVFKQNFDKTKHFKTNLNKKTIENEYKTRCLELNESV